MKNIFPLLLSLLLSLSAAPSQAQVKTLPESPLAAFDALRVSGKMNVTLIGVDAGEPLRIVYDLGDNEPEKFRFSIKRDGVLDITLSNSPKTIDIAKVTIYYRNLKDIKISRATAEIEGEFNPKVADIRLDYEAKLSGKVNCDDLLVEMNAESKIDLTGEVRYLTLKAASSAVAELRKIENQSANITCSSGAVVAFNAGERLVVSLSTGAVVKYDGEPQILRTSSNFLGGSLVKIE